MRPHSTVEAPPAVEPPAVESPGAVPPATQSAHDESPRESIALEDHLPEAGAADTKPFRRLGTRTATPVRREARSVWVRLRGYEDEVLVAVDPEVDLELVDDAIAAGDGVIVETTPHEPPSIVGVMFRRVAAHKIVRADRITLEAQDEILLRAGTSALRLRADGDVEVVGSRISATSRGLFRLVGRLLRLN